MVARYTCGIVQSGWAGLDGGEADDRILTIGEVPHEWLFPHMAALVHHCGAGTTAAGLRAGVPTVGLPVLADQPFWHPAWWRSGSRPAQCRCVTSPQTVSPTR